MLADRRHGAGGFDSQAYGEADDAGGINLIFPSSPHPTRSDFGRDMPDAHHLDLCKEIAWSGHLNCRLCVTSKGNCSEEPDPPRRLHTCTSLGALSSVFLH
jgi:hypothetical protein